MAGVHGCGCCWEAGAESSTKAFGFSAWTHPGPIHRPAHPSSTAPRIRCSLREESSSWAAPGGDTRGCWWRRRRRWGLLLHPNIRARFFSSELKVMRRCTKQQLVCVQWICAAAKWLKGFLIGVKTVIVSLFLPWVSSTLWQTRLTGLKL